MIRSLHLLACGVGTTIQDQGRDGWQSHGLSRGGAADPWALAQGAAVLGQPDSLAAIELGLGAAVVRVRGAMRLALTGPMRRLHIDGAVAQWGAILCLSEGARIEIGPPQSGAYAYLSVGGGIDSPLCLGGRGAHLTAGIGAGLQPGTVLAVGCDPDPHRVGLGVADAQRVPEAPLRATPGLHHAAFSPAERARFETTTFTVTSRASRAGIALNPDGCGWASQARLGLVSDVICPGDVQIIGDGSPVVLGPECQTIGGYPRIATVLPSDLARLMQALPGTKVAFCLIDPHHAREIEAHARHRRAGLAAECRPVLRNPHDIADLGAYQLIGGVTDGAELDKEGA